LKAKIIIIGNELLYGRIADTNGPWLAKWLDARGIEVCEIQVLPDEREVLLRAFEDGLKSCDLILTSGGIGPTKDDMTKSLLAEFTGKKLRPCEETAKIVIENYKYYDREWTPDLNSYHHIPEDFIATPNPKGLAPGLVFINNNKLIAAAPGVPRELKAMVEEEFAPYIDKLFKEKYSPKSRIVIRTARVPEEKIFKELCPTLWDELSQFGLVSSLPQVIGVDIVVTLSGSDPSDELVKIKKLIEKSALNEHVWQWDNTPLPELVINEARNKKLTFAFAESCTGGLTASRITDIPGCSDVFIGSLVTYSNDAKTNILGVKQQTLKKFGAVSEEVVEEMACGLLDKIGADLVLAFSGIAGPTGGSESKPVGTLALASGKKGEIEKSIFKFAGDRERLKLRFSEIGLFYLLKLIRNY
tara:strand:+ start:129261 stop:130505 length:1245 start_codon:yes stop_codon:yes gene_type:complete